MTAPRPSTRPRPWQCTTLLATYCPLCGVCGCGDLGPSLGNAICALHGPRAEHGTRRGVVA